MKSIRMLSVCLVAASTLWVGVAHGQDVETFDVPVGEGHLFTAAGADTTIEGRVSTAIWLTYANDPLIRRNSDGDVTGKLIEQMTTVHLLGAYGITDELELGFALPFGFTEGADISILGGTEGGAAGDMRIAPRYRFLGGQTREGLRMAATLDITLPTGDGTRGFGNESTTITPTVAADWKIPHARVVGNLGFRIRPEKETLANIEIGNEVVYALGAEAGLFRTEPATYIAVLEFHGVAPAGSVDDLAASAPVEGLLGIRSFMKSGHVATMGAGYGLVDGYGAPRLRFMVGYAYSPHHDRCSSCNAPPPPKDSDGDGLMDPADACPMQPEDKDGFEDMNGCPDPDNDQDGIADVADQCPLKAEDKDGDADEDGCPEDDAGPADADGDGIADGDDKCPEAPEDKDTFEDADGCPDPDNDQDGVGDELDKCPLEPEVVNGFEDKDGCPDEKPAVQVTCKSIELGDKIYFETGRYVIQERSFPLLDAIAKTLEDNPQIKRIRLEGHTDNRGTAEGNEKLSTQRVWVVRQYLAGKGISKKRLAYKGFGQTRPIATNDTDEGRAQNRRVSIAILEADKRAGCD